MFDFVCMAEIVVEIRLAKGKVNWDCEAEMLVVTRLIGHQTCVLWIPILC